MPKASRQQRYTRPRAAGKSVKLDLFGTVGTFPEDGYSLKTVSAAIEGASEVNIRLNSDGGDAREGFAIYNLLRESKAKVNVEVVAAAMSAASYILMAADHSTIHSNAVVMIHEAWGGAQGRAQDFDRQAAELRRINDHMVAAYVARTGLEEDEIRKLVADETNIDAADAVKMGLVDELLKTKAPTKALAMLDPVNLTRAPQSFVAAVAAARAENEKANTMTFADLKAALEDMTDEEKKDLAKMLSLKAEGEEDDEEEAKAKAKSKSKAEGEEEEDDEMDAKAVLAAVKQALGVSAAGKDPVRAVAALATNSRDSLAKLRAAEARIEALEARGAERDLESALSDAERVTPAFAKAMRKAVADGAMTVEGVKAAVEALPKIPGYVAPGAKSPRPQAVGRDHKYEGKTFAEMNGAEKHRLYHEDPDLYQSMRAAHVSN